MQLQNVSQLKNNPSLALRGSQSMPVVVMNRHEPEAMIFGLQKGSMLGGLQSQPGVQAALATALFREGGLSLARAAKLADLPLSRFITHVSRLGIPVVELDAEDAQQDMESLDAWLAQSAA